MNEFEKELTGLINRFSEENASNTPDFILAQYLIACLAAWNTGIQQRENWYGRDLRPTSMAGDNVQRELDTVNHSWLDEIPLPGEGR